MCRAERNCSAKKLCTAQDSRSSQDAHSRRWCARTRVLSTQNLRRLSSLNPLTYIHTHTHTQIPICEKFHCINNEMNWLDNNFPSILKLGEHNSVTILIKFIRSSSSPLFFWLRIRIGRTCRASIQIHISI